ncbi:MAG: alpha/beta fold hydrolase [Corynebacterium sp.]|nr:alpha/beta fold hydrolase [Corynebacterium sp.]
MKTFNHTLRQVVSIGAVTATALLSMATIPIATAQAAPAITWEKCPNDKINRPNVRCGHIEVPENYANPGGKKITVGFIQVPNTGAPAVFTNPGGPSGSVYEWLGQTKFSKLPAEFFNQFEVIGVQPRGLVGSTPLDCPTAPNVNLVEEFLGTGDQLRRNCDAKQPGYADQITTENTARDWEEVRKALKRETINIYGLSYGTILGSSYATLFPNRVDKLVLDSGIDTNLQWSEILARQEPGYRDALHEFFAYVALNDAKYHAGTTPYAVYRKWAATVKAESGVTPSIAPPKATPQDLLAGSSGAGQAGADVMNAVEPGHAQAENFGTQLGAGGKTQQNSLLMLYTQSFLPMPYKWDTIARGINDPKVMEQDLQDMGALEASESEIHAAIVSKQMQRLIMCNESVTVPRANEMPRALWNTLVIKDPFSSGQLLFSSGFACQGTKRITPGVAFDGSKLKVKPLQIQGKQDPQTPYGNFGNMQSAMQSTLVTVNGPGHGHFGYGNKAVDKMVLDYLHTGKATAGEVPGYFG